MLRALQFVRGAVAKKDFVPALTHFNIHNGVIRGFNGRIALSSPIDLDLDATPKAVPFIKAIQTCRETVQMNLTPTGRLSVRSGRFRALVDCSNEPYPEVAPCGDRIELTAGFLAALKEVFPFIAEDASRPWARGVLLRGGSAFATNNIVIVERWLGYNFPVEINIPKEAAQELIRIGDEPQSLQMTSTSATFHYSGDRWLRTQLFTTEWPDVSGILDRESKQAPLPDDFYTAIDDVAPFVNEHGQVYITEQAITTGVSEESPGATVELPGIGKGGCYNIKYLAALKPIIKTIDFSLYPDPCIFYGDQIRGAIVGMRL